MSTASSGHNTASRALTLPTQPTEQQGKELPTTPALSAVSDSLATPTSSYLLVAAMPASPVIAMPVQSRDASYTPPTLLSLSAEILHRIAAELRASGDRPALYNLCSTSKVLRDVAQIPLFSMFELSEKSLNHFCEFCDRVNIDKQINFKLLHFTRAVFQREDLAAGINSISLDFQNISNTKLPRLNKSDKALFSRTFQALYPQITDWKIILEDREIYRLLSFLLTRLQNLRRITLSVPFNVDMEYLFLSSPLYIETVQVMFPVLRFVSVSGTPVDARGHLPELSSFVLFLAIPTLQEFHADKFSLHHWGNPFIDSAQYMWELPHLRLQNCMTMNVTKFKKMVSFFSDLELLKFTAGDNDRKSDEDRFIEPADFMCAIECHAHSLKYLDINLNNIRYQREGMYDYKGRPNTLTIGSMHRFEKMEELYIDASRVGPVCNLPPNLTHLVLRESLDIDHALRRTVMQKNTKMMPNLREVCPLLREIFIMVTDEIQMLSWGGSSKNQVISFGKGSYVFIPNLPYALYICLCPREDHDQLIEGILSRSAK